MSFFSGMSNVFKSVGGAINPIMPLLGVGTDILGSVMGVNAQKEANAQNVALQRENRSWEEEMANTAHQREVTDLKAAGLNPMLSVNSGASVPNVSAASIDSLGPMISSSARSIKDAFLNQKNLEAEIAVKRSQVAANSALATKADADANVANTSALGVAFDNAAKEADLPAKVRASLNKAYEEEYRKRRPWFWKDFGINMGDVMKTGGKLLSH